MRPIKIIAAVFLAVSIVCWSGWRLYLYKYTDDVAPIISFSDDRVMSVSVNADDEKLLEGVSAKDNVDGDVTSSIRIEKMSNFIEKGRRNVTYAAFDKSGNVSKATREIAYTDYVSPTFSLSKPLLFGVNATTIITGLTAKDCIDGNITDSIVISPGYSISTYTSGSTKIQYEVTNSSGDTVYLPVTVEIYDDSTESLSNVSLKKYLIYVKKGSKINYSKYIAGVSSGITVQKIGSEVSLSDFSIDSSSVDTSVSGTYEAIYSYKNNSTSVKHVRLIIIVED